MKTRSLLGGTILVAAVIIVLLLASCSSAPSSTSTPAAASKPYGSLVAAVSFGNVGLDPMMMSRNTLQTAALGILDSLVELTPGAQMRPGIAEKWDISTDGKSHTFYIRKGVKFQDGSDLTGADVKFSLERILDPKATNLDSPTWRAAIAGVDLKDDYTVVIRLKDPLFELLTGFADFGGSPAVVPKKYVEAVGNDGFAARPVGSGPWKVVKWEPGSRLELEAMESHWRAVPKFENLTLLNVPEEGTKVAMLKTGELDIANVAPDSAPSLKSAGVRIIGFEGGAQYYAGPYYDLDQPDKYALGSVDVRKAMSLAVDRKEMGDKLYGGYAEPSGIFYARPTAYFWDANALKPDAYDPDGAKKLLAKAGYPNGFPAKIWDMGGGGMLSILNQALAGYWRKVGVNATIETIDQAAVTKLMTRPRVQPQLFETVRPSLSGGGVFQFEKMATVYHSKKGSVLNINNPKLDELIDKVPLTANPAEKKKLALEAAVMAKNEYNAIPVLEMKTLLALGSKVGEITPIKGMTGLGAAYDSVTHAK
ncbi:MAG: ABC transporter substrate-binding protein [Chloroflexi bacterium]|nr:ABC transporter substrate-binding protein [Chloroflexota bacterium]